VAQSHTPRSSCVRFVAVVTAGSRNTRLQAARYALPGLDFHQPIAPASWRLRLFCQKGAFVRPGEARRPFRCSALMWRFIFGGFVRQICLASLLTQNVRIHGVILGSKYRTIVSNIVLYRQDVSRFGLASFARPQARLSDPSADGGDRGQRPPNIPSAKGKKGGLDWRGRIAERTEARGGRDGVKNASKFDPTKKGAHVIGYMEKSISSVEANRAKLDPTKFLIFPNDLKALGRFRGGSLSDVFSHRKVTPLAPQRRGRIGEPLTRRYH
jgi:hypothetical protein